MTRALFLPGAGGSAAFWRPVAERLSGEKVMLTWPGLGNEPPRAGVESVDDLVGLVLEQLTEPADIVAQSMGGLVAVRAALAAPEKVRRLVLAVTSGGVPVADLGGADWRGDYYTNFPRAARWIGEAREDLSRQIQSIETPTMLIWGDADPISPVAVGERLLTLLPHAELRVVQGGDHDLAQTHADLVALWIAEHLGR